MLEKIAISIQISVLISTASSNLLQPEYSIKILNTENVILSLGDIDLEGNDDLEIIKDEPDDPELDSKLSKFHKIVDIMQVSELPLENFFYNPPMPVTEIPVLEVYYPDSPYEIAVNRKHLNMLERRSKKKQLWMRQMKLRKKLKKKLKKLFEKRRKILTGDYEKREVSTKENRDESDKKVEELEDEYHDYVEQSRLNNKAYKYTDEGKPEESFKEVIKKITDVKIPRNCTNVTGVGLQAVECLVKKIQKKELTTREIIQKTSFILLVWFGVYVAVAVPLWCARGWCCCCCRCSICLPNKTVREIQKYISQNPPGIYVNAKGEEEHYNPTVIETELYERLKRSIMEY